MLSIWSSLKIYCLGKGYGKSKILLFGKGLKLWIVRSTVQSAWNLTHSLIHHFVRLSQDKEAADDNWTVAIKGF